MYTNYLSDKKTIFGWLKVVFLSGIHCISTDAAYDCCVVKAELPVFFWITLNVHYIIIAADPEGPGVCAMLLTMLSFLLVLVTMPFSLCATIKVKKP